MSATILQFIPKADPDREERLRRRMIDAANAIYESIFPAEGDTSPSEMNPDGEG